MDKNEFTYVAKTDLSAKKGYAVYVTTDAEVNNTPVVDICTANKSAVVGIITDPGVAGQSIGVAIEGFVNAVVGENVTAGAFLKTNTAGKLVVASSDKDHVIAQAQKAGNSGEEVQVLIRKFDLAV